MTWNKEIIVREKTIVEERYAAEDIVATTGVVSLLWAMMFALAAAFCGDEHLFMFFAGSTATAIVVFFGLLIGAACSEKDVVVRYVELPKRRR